MEKNLFWRITSPIRFAKRFIRHGLLVEDRKWFEKKLRFAFRALPSGKYKTTLRECYVGFFGRPILDSSSSPVFMSALDMAQSVHLGDKESGFLSPEHWPHQSEPYGVLVFPVEGQNSSVQRLRQIAHQYALKGHHVAYGSLDSDRRATVTSFEDFFDLLRPSGTEDANAHEDIPSPLVVDAAVDAFSSYIDRKSSISHWICIVQSPWWGAVVERLRARTSCQIVYDFVCSRSEASFEGKAAAHLLGQSSLAVVSSDSLLGKVSAFAPNSVLIQNAVDYTHFEAISETRHRPGSSLIIGCHAAASDWFDGSLVAGIAKLRKNWKFILIGNISAANARSLAVCDNISTLGEISYQKLPEFIAHWDCGIIPFERFPSREAGNPIEIYEMLAAGKPVVSVALTDLMPMASAGHIALAETAEEFVRSIEIQVLQDTAIKQQARQCSAAENTWTSRLSHLDQAVRSAFPKATIIVVTYNNLALNRLCLESLLNDTDYPNYEIVVVDNASSDGTLEYLSGIHDSRFTMIHNKVNLGFAAANNQGLKCARGDFLCLLNNDTVVTGSWLSDLVKHLQIHPDIGLIGPVTNSIGNEAKISVDYRDLVDLPKWSAQYCEVNKGRLDDISMLAFFCVVMPRAVFECVGLLDERFGLGMFEDDDYNRRVRAAGYKALLARDVYVHHWQRASFKLLGEDVYHEIFQQNRLKYQSKWIAESLSQKDAESLSNLLERSKNTPKTIIFAPSIGWSIHLFQRPHHLARAFSRQGYMVVFDCTGSHEKISFLEEIEHGLFLYSGKAELLAGLHQPVLWTFTYNYGYRDYFQKDIPVVYDWIDDLSVFPYDQTLLAQAHARAMSEAAVVCSVAKRLHCAALKDRSDAIYLPNAVEQGRFDRIPDPNPAKRDEIFNRIASSKKFIAGYYGALAEWFDYELLVRVAELRQDWYFVLIGPDHDGSMGHSTIGRCSNIVWLGPRDYADLPGYLNLFDVAIIPFKINDITLATSPLKLFEYFAGGKPVLTTQMPECMAFGEVFIAQNAEEFALLLDPARCAATDQKYTARLENLAELNSWEARTQVVLSALSSQGARSIMNAFRDKESIDNKNFFRALASHLSDIADDPRLSMYFNFALSTNDRGREVARLIAKHIEILGKLHLDIGCAYGGFLVAFAEHGAESFGFDIDPTLLGLAERNFQDSGRNFRIYQKDVTRWEEIAEFKGKFDIITCNDVIEHVSDPATAFEHIALLLNEGGVAYFEIPNRDAAPFVLSDGHYQLFGITQLDKADAADYFSAHAPGVPYTVEHYLRLPEYRELMGRVGLSLEVLPESLANVGRQAIENIADDIESSFEDRLLSVPASIRDKVSESVRTYLSRIKSDASFTDREKRDSYLLTYGVSFWKIVARKVCIEPERAVFEKAGSSTLEEKSNV